MSDVQEKPVRVIIRKEDFAQEYNDGTILVKHVRACYPHVFRPYKSADDPADKKARHSIIGLMPKIPLYFPSKNVIRDRINLIAVQNKNPDLPAERRFLRDGSLRKDKPEYVGNFTISPAEERRPTVLGSRKDPKTGKPVRLVAGVDEDLIYGGCWVNMLIRPWWQNNNWGKRVNAGLVAVQLIPIETIRKFLPDATDEAFGEGRISEDAVDETFGDLSADDSGYDDGLDNTDDLDL